MTGGTAGIWVREGILPDYPNNRSPQFDFDDGQLVIPKPTTSREEIQNQGIRDSEIPRRVLP
jgi:ribonuclease Z